MATSTSRRPGRPNEATTTTTTTTTSTIASRSTSNLLHNILLGTKTTVAEDPHEKKKEVQQERATVEPVPHPPSLLVVGAGLGRTSTSSLTSALQQFSSKYRTYQMTDGVQGVSGHVDLWHKYMEARHKVGKRLANRGAMGDALPSAYYKEDDEVRAAETALLESLVRDAVNQGFVATASMPPCFLFEALMREFPDAIVMLTVRSEKGDKAAAALAWAQSMQQTVLNVPVVFERVPFRWIDRTRKVGHMIEYMMEELGTPYVHDITTCRIASPPSTEELMGAYNHWNDHVRATVPPHRLLVHRAKDGWTPICQSSEALQEACHRANITSETPYPHVNDAQFFQYILGLLQGIAFVTESTLIVGPPLLVLGAFAWVWKALKRRRRHTRRPLAGENADADADDKRRPRAAADGDPKVKQP